MSLLLLHLLLLSYPIRSVLSKQYNYLALGAVPDNNSSDTEWFNGKLMNDTLAALQPGDVLVVPNTTFYLMGGILASKLDSVTIQIDGTLIYSARIDEWPRQSNGKVLMCMLLSNINNVTFTSSGTGTLNGQGGVWWGIPGVGYIVHQENRPRLLEIDGGTNVLVENLFLLDSPYWTFWAHGMNGLEVRYTDIRAARTEYDGHDLVDMSAFNTDGFDVSGKNVWIHDCSVWNQDDTIAVKDDAENMLFERITASGVGLTIVSIGSGNVVRNITFKDCAMPNTYKGIYMKFREPSGDTGAIIEDILYQNITIVNPSQWTIWIGPAQQSDSSRLCAAHPCSICWPFVPHTQCFAPPLMQYRNITLRDITVTGGKISPGLIYGNATTPMDGVLFDNVYFDAPGLDPWQEDYYLCEGVSNGVATGNTWPVPPCFQDNTNRAMKQRAAERKQKWGKVVSN